MRELLDYLRANGFTTYIVSGGGVEFLRVVSEELYGVPPQQVIGSSIKTKYELRDGKPVIVRLPELDFIDDKAGKPVGIHKFIGKRPIAAFGNSDGDFEMLEWTTSAPGARLGLIVHHDDACASTPTTASAIGKLDRGLDEAGKRGWTRGQHEERLADGLRAGALTGFRAIAGSRPARRDGRERAGATTAHVRGLRVPGICTALMDPVRDSHWTRLRRPRDNFPTCRCLWPLGS